MTDKDEKFKEMAIELTKLAFEQVKEEIAQIEKSINADDDGERKVGAVKVLTLLSFIREEMHKRVLDHTLELMTRSLKDKK